MTNKTQTFINSIMTALNRMSAEEITPEDFAKLINIDLEVWNILDNYDESGEDADFRIFLEEQ